MQKRARKPILFPIEKRRLFFYDRKTEEHDTSLGADGNVRSRCRLFCPVSFHQSLESEDWLFLYPIVLAGILLGPLSAGLVGLVADVLGATLFPIGAFFPGFSLTSFITAFGYGFFLHKNQSMKNIVAAVLFSEIVGTIFLNTLWISILYGAPFVAVLIPRLAQAAGMGVVEVLCICFMTKYVSQMKRVF